MVTIIINNTKTKVPDNTTVLQACNSLNIDIPKFCFHENLGIAGNCRMCLVEIINSPKPVVSCSMPVMEGMRIFTGTPLVKKARELVLEFLLINHPLDCPICDQGGECDLQEQTTAYGSDKSRFFLNKRSVEDKNCSVFIKTIMTRCIHCTRCIRFSKEVCGVDGLGTPGRGNITEISFYLSKMFNSEFSANVIDLCPVGALTSKPYTFKARTWELNEQVTIDLFGTLGTKIIVQCCNNKIIRVLPKIGNVFNIEWITNKTRFFFDSIEYQRLAKPMLKQKGVFSYVTWEQAFKILKIKSMGSDCSKKSTIIGDFIGLEEVHTFKAISNMKGIPEIIYFNNNSIKSDIANNQFFFNDPIQGICLLINCNLRIESPLLNLKFKNNVIKNILQVYSIGPLLNSTYNVINLGLTLDILIQILKGKHKLCRQLLVVKKFTVIINSNFNIRKNINFINLLNSFLQNEIKILTLDSGFLNYSEIIGSRYLSIKKKLKFNIFYNTDFSIKKLKKIKKDKNFSIYIGHHFNNNAELSNLILPTLTFLEKKGSFINTMGKIQQTEVIKLNKCLIKNDLVLFKYIFGYVYKPLTIIKFNKLFKYLYYNQIQTIRQNINKNKIPVIVNLTFLKPASDKFYPKNVFEKNSKILINSLTRLQQSSNFIL